VLVGAPLHCGAEVGKVACEGESLHNEVCGVCGVCVREELTGIVSGCNGWHKEVNDLLPKHGEVGDGRGGHENEGFETHVVLECDGSGDGDKDLVCGLFGAFGQAENEDELRHNKIGQWLREEALGHPAIDVAKLGRNGAKNLKGSEHLERVPFEDRLDNSIAAARDETNRLEIGEKLLGEDGALCDTVVRRMKSKTLLGGGENKGLNDIEPHLHGKQSVTAHMVDGVCFEKTTKHELVERLRFLDFLHLRERFRNAQTICTHYLYITVLVHNVTDSTCP